ncbi:mitochondrial sodium/calcium exchanger protein-like isoform X3 [Drosophila miranda]|nr:mitochondrial sodium/calcium exchanger protein-like isoform X3 [Drosophila miranda]
MILKSPLKLICTLFLPIVDYEIYRHGWCKLLNCIQIITTPLIGITLIHSIMSNEFTGFVIIPQFAYAQWSLCMTVPLAIIVFVHSRTDIPPVYHSMFLGLNAGGCLLILGICAAELEILCCIAGLIVYLSEGFVAVTFRSMAGSIDDTIVVVSLALEGYEQLALGAILGAPIFNTLVSMGLAILLQETVRHGTAWIFMWIQNKIKRTYFLAENPPKNQTTRQSMCRPCDLIARRFFPQRQLMISGIVNQFYMPR